MKYEEDRHWSLYLSSVSNPFSEPQTFNEFLEKLKIPKTSQINKPDQRMDKEQTIKQLDIAENLLSGFVPPIKGGD